MCIECIYKYTSKFFYMISQHIKSMDAGGDKQVSRCAIAQVSQRKVQLWWSVPNGSYTHTWTAFCFIANCAGYYIYLCNTREASTLSHFYTGSASVYENKCREEAIASRINTQRETAAAAAPITFRQLFKLCFSGMQNELIFIFAANLKSRLCTPHP